MEITEIGALHIAQKADAILHVPGNYQGGILELAVVIDTSLKKEEFQDSLAAVIRALKKKQEIFRNVRLNLVYWKTEEIVSKIVPMTMLMTDSAFEDYRICQDKKYYEDLFSYLKKFHARSKLVLVFAGGQNEIMDVQEAKEALSPFLKNKLLLICAGNEPGQLHDPAAGLSISDWLISGTQIFMELCRI